MITTNNPSGKAATRDQILSNVHRWRREHGLAKGMSSRRDFNQGFNAVAAKIPQKLEAQCKP